MSSSVTPEWTIWWPLMRKRLLRFLQSRGISAHAAEDAVQDVAERLLTRQVPHTGIDDLMRWCMTVARNSAIDQHRRVRRSVPLDDRTDEVDDGSELVDVVQARIRLASVLRALRQMSHEDLQCVMDGLDGDATLVATPALRARRHRVRRRLSQLVGGFGLIGVIVRALRPRPGRTTLGLGAAAMAGAALITAVVGPPIGAGSPHVRLHVGPATVRAQAVVAPVPSVRRPTGPAALPRRAHAAAAATPTPPSGGSTGLHLRSPDKRGTVDVQGHDRRPSDRGNVCIDGLHYVPEVCAGVTRPKVPPAT